MAEIDLDAVMERSDAALHPDLIEGEHDAIEMETRYWKSAKDVPVLVAELRLLREVVDAARLISQQGGARQGGRLVERLTQRVRAYDAVTGGAG